ncbi:NIP7 pre-PUA domain-containing protein [Pyrococcus yayanosii]|uniref:Uncharacterized protein n=1 Tax=Pyrococcus yayanosii (strain CH1 / JCM 16557) TaxID=529709 RepID=F8AHJ3_PYRYC|nr:hypothetical protein [Pyrococcus yayanosii]AEH25364.1 hypothetical protein PYCH_17050 [Pyrococcus yayanosii CH1]
MSGELRVRRLSAWEFDLLLKEAEKHGELVHDFFALVEGRFRDVYAVNEEVWRRVEALGMRPYAFGTFVGTIKVDESLVEKFYPNIEFFYFVDVQKNYAVLGPKAAFLFTTGKDVPRRGVRKLVWRGSKRLVIFDGQGNIIGLGLVDPKDEERFIKNMGDVGEFLRRKRRE